MNPKIVKLNDAQVVIGLEWELLDFASSERKAIRDILKKNPGVKSGVLVRAADVATLGMMPAGNKKPAVPSGAALLALANQDAQAVATGQSSSIEDNQWIVVERLSDDEFWVVDIKDGVPLPGSDFVGGYEKVRAYLTEMIEGTGFKVFTTDPDIQSVVAHQALVIPKGAAEIIAETEKHNRASLKVLSGIDPAMVSVIAVVFLLVLGFVGWSMWSARVEEQRQQAAAAARASADAQRLAQEKAEYSQAVAMAVEAALDQGVSAVNTALETASPRDVIAAWVGMIETVPLNHSGWETQRADCMMETATKPVCTVFVKRTASGINRILLEDYPQMEIIGDEASYVLRGPELAMRKPEWSQVDSAQAFVKGLMSDLQFARASGLNYTQGESKDITQAIAMPTPPESIFNPGDPQQAAPVPPINTGMAQGTLGLSGANLWMLSGMAALLDRNAVSLTSMTANLEGVDDQSWTAEGVFFIRSLPAPVIPVILGPDGPITVPLPEKFRYLVSEDATTGGVGATTALPLPAPPAQAGASAPGQPGPTDGPAPSADPMDPPPVEGPISLGLPDAPSDPPSQ